MLHLRFSTGFFLYCFAYIALLQPVNSHAQGLSFEQTSLAEALVKAQKTNKLVFIDAFTTWCGPCKMMTKEVFTDSLVADFFEQNFVNVKLDMEKGEGIAVAERYQVWVYPSLLFLDYTGTVQHRSAAFHNPQDLLALAQTALDSTQNLAAMGKIYAAGNRHKTFLLQYLKAKSAAFDPDAGRLANEFLKTEEDLSSPENMELLMQHVDDPYSKSFQFLLKNSPLFEEKYDKRAVKVKIESVFEGYLERHPNLQLGEVQRLYATLYPEGGEELASRYRLDYYRQKDDSENFARTAVDHYTRFPSHDPDELNEMASIFSEEYQDADLLAMALAWADKAISLQETSYYYYTRAKVLARMGKKKLARSTAEQALQMAQSEGADATLISEFLEGLKRK